MAEILSQSQIDALLKGISDGGVQNTPSMDPHQKKIKDYDFRSPKKFTKEQLRLIDNLHENLGRQLSSYFSGILRMFSEVKVLQVEEQRYYEFNNALADNTLIALMELKPEDDNIEDLTIMMEVSSTIAFTVIDRLLGGTGNESAVSRDFTEIELNIMRNVFSKLTYYLQEAWGTYIPISAKLASLETNPRLLQLFSPEDIVVIVLLELKMKDSTGNISICLPASSLESAMGEFTPKYMRAVSKSKHFAEKEMTRKETIEQILTGAYLDLRIIFDTIEIDLAEVLRLQQNDVIQLKKPLNSDVEVIIDNTSYFKGSLGQFKNKKAIRINKIY